jgi:uncharacterized protein (DUF1499 family)
MAAQRGPWLVILPSGKTHKVLRLGERLLLLVDQKMILTKNLDNMSEKELESRLKQIIDDHKTFLDPNAEVIESESSSLSMPEESSSDPQN